MATAAIRAVNVSRLRLMRPIERNRRDVDGIARSAPAGVAWREWKDIAGFVERLRRRLQALLAQFTVNARKGLPQIGFRARGVAE